MASKINTVSSPFPGPPAGGSQPKARETIETETTRKDKGPYSPTPQGDFQNPTKRNNAQR